MKSPVFASLWPRRTPFFIPKWMKGFLAKIWIKIVHHLTHIPLADTHAPPERARKWRPDHGEAIVPSVSMATPVPRCQLTLCLMKRFVSHLSWRSRGTGFRLPKRPHSAFVNLKNTGMYLRSFRGLCGKCASAHTCVMWCFSQVLEASFHCVTFWHHPGLPAPPSAAMRRSVTDNRAAPELLQVCLSCVAMKTKGNEDAVLSHATCSPHVSRFSYHTVCACKWCCTAHML